MAVAVTITVGTTDYGFDFVDEEIEIEATADSITTTDLKSAIRQAEASFEGIVFPDVAETGNPVLLDSTNNVSTALNVILLDGWRILTLKSSGTFLVTGGNTVRDLSGVDIFALNASVTKTNIVSANATQIATGSGLTVSEQTQLSEIHTRLDLETANPNTYADDGSSISNNEFTLTKNDNGDGTFDVDRT